MRARNGLVRAALLAAGLVSAGAGRAATTAAKTPVAANHDLQCLIATLKLTQSADDQAKAVGTMGSLYFAGKVAAADPAINLPAAAQAEAAKMQGTDLNAVALACGSEIQARGQQLEDTGKALTAKGL